MAEEDALFEEEPREAVATPPVRVRKRRSMFDDPVVRRLTYVALGLVVLYLVTIVSALLMGVVGSPVPDTKVERDVAAYEARVMQAPEDVDLWAEYVAALLTSEQYVRAQDVIDRASKVVDQSPSQALLVAQAQLYHDTGRHKEAVETADKVRKLLETRFEKVKEQEGTPEYFGSGLSDNYYTVLLVKAEALMSLGKTQEAKEALDLYLKEKNTDAAAFVRRGTIKIELDDKAGAEEDFRTALKFIPDYPQALEGLQKIGAE